MRIRQKILISQVVLLAVFTVAVGLAGYFIWLRGYVQLERQETLNKLTRLETAFNGQAYALSQLLNDWAAWDECYAYALGQNSEFAGRYLSSGNLSNLDLSLLAVYDRNGRLTQFMVRDRDREQEEAYRRAMAGVAIGQRRGWQAEDNNEVTVVYAGDMPILLARQPITPTNRQGQPAGWLVFGRAMDAEFVGRMLKQAMVGAVRISPPVDPSPAMLAAAEQKDRLVEIYPRQRNGSASFAYVVVAAAEDRQVFYNLDYETPDSGWLKMSLFVGLLLVVGGGLITLYYWFARRMLLDKLATIDRFVSGFRLTASGRQQRLVVEGQDELADLAAIVNKSFVEIGSLYEKLRDELNERKKAQAELTRALAAAQQADRVKQEFLANVSHELRTPMNALVGMSEMLTMMVDDPEAADFAASISQSAHALNILLNDVLILTQRGDINAGPVVGPVSPREMVRTVIKALLGERGRQQIIVEEYGDNLPEAVCVDGARIRQILLNLLSNAVKFGGGKPVTVSVALTDNDDDRPGRLAITVADQGVGMSEEVMARIFEPFFQADGSSTRRYGGIGAGMAVVKQLVDGLEGQITISSRVGEGTSVVVVVPLAGEGGEKPNVG
ncbi:MAG: ATP-binding protein [Negativicutes bacterium]|nr:ATP-binding protein [Negativicutes bacterium]